MQVSQNKLKECMIVVIQCYFKVKKIVGFKNQLLQIVSVFFFLIKDDYVPAKRFYRLSIWFVCFYLTMLRLYSPFHNITLFLAVKAFSLPYSNVVYFRACFTFPSKQNQFWYSLSYAFST